MADDDEVRQDFIADAEQYIRPLEEAAETAESFADANRTAREATDTLRGALAGVSEAAGHFRDEAIETRASVDELRDVMTEMVGATGSNTAAMDELRNKLVEVAGAADAAKRELKGVRDVETETAAVGALSKFFSFAGGGGSILMSLLNPGNIAAFVTGLIVVAPVIAALLVEITGVISGLTAAGAGVGAFAALAYPAIKKVASGYTAVTTAEGAYRKAVAAEDKDDSTKNIKATAAALAKLKAAWGAMDPAERGAVRGIQELKSSYERMAKAFEPDVFKIFNQGLRIANELLPDIKPFADTAAGSISRLLGELGKFFKTSKTVLEPIGKEGHGLVPVQVPTGFGTFLQQLNKINGPALTAIGNGIGSVANALGKLVTVLPASADVAAINIPFSVLRGTIELLTRAVRLFHRDWLAMTGSIAEAVKNIVRWNADILRFAKILDDDVKRAFATSKRDVKQWADDVGDDFMDAVHHVAQWATDVHQWFDEVLAWIGSTWDHIVARIRSAWDKVVSYTRTIPSKIKGALGDLGSLLVSSGEALIRGLISGIESAIPGLQSVVGWVKSIVSDLFGGGGGGGPSQAPQIRAPGAAPQVHGLVSQGPMAGGPGGGNMTVHVHVAGSVVSEQELGRTVQRVILDHQSRNATAGMVLSGRRS